MNGLEFARCTTAGGFRRVLIHAGPHQAKVEIVNHADLLVARANLERRGHYSPMTLIELEGSQLPRSEEWPLEHLCGLRVLLVGGEVGVLHTGSTAMIETGRAGRSSSPTIPARPTGAGRVWSCAAAEHPRPRRHPARALPG